MSWLYNFTDTWTIPSMLAGRYEANFTKSYWFTERSSKTTTIDENNNLHDKSKKLAYREISESISKLFQCTKITFFNKQ